MVEYENTLPKAIETYSKSEKFTPRSVHQTSLLASKRMHKCRDAASRKLPTKYAKAESKFRRGSDGVFFFFFQNIHLTLGQTEQRGSKTERIPRGVWATCCQHVRIFVIRREERGTERKRAEQLAKNRIENVFWRHPKALVDSPRPRRLDLPQQLRKKPPEM